MNAAVILIIGIVILALGYVFYGGWLSKQWGIDPSRSTPAHELEDGMDYCPAKAPVLMGHHFSSIAGAGPINGPIQAAVFGWVPVHCGFSSAVSSSAVCMTTVHCLRLSATTASPSAPLLRAVSARRQSACSSSSLT